MPAEYAESIELFKETLPQRAIPQPRPALHPPGDCGACVLGGVLDLPVDEVYQRYQGGVKPFTYDDMHRSLLEAERRDYLFDFVEVHHPIWSVPYNRREWGGHGWTQALPWWRRIRMAIEAGIYALVLVALDKQGPVGRGVDHWALIVGVRKVNKSISQKGKPAVSVIAHEVLVSCPASDTPVEEWVEVGSFLRSRGGFNCLLARPYKIA